MYQQIGGFDMEMVRNQDDELSYRLLKNGGRIVCSPSIRSTYYNRSSLSSLWRLYFQYGWYKVRVLQKHPIQMRPRHFVPPLFVLALIASLLLALFPVFQPLAALIPLTYLLASLLYSFHTASRQGSKYIFVLPSIYAVLRLSYGLGFLLGLGKFWNRWNDREGKVPRFSHDPSG